MSYKPLTPRKMGVSLLTGIEVKPLIRYIDWKFFFRTWRLIGDYSALISTENITKEQWLNRSDVKEKERAEQVFDLWSDARQQLNKLLDEHKIRINAVVGLYEAASDSENIMVKNGAENVVLPMLRQQQEDERGNCLSLADFIADAGDYIGAFAVAVHLHENQVPLSDDYTMLLQKSLADRLAEATAEWVHEQIRKTYWGFASDESLSVEEMMQSRFQGIRPAVGYPSLPDQSLLFKMQKLLPLHTIGIELTENGAMNPSSSVCSLVFAHPESRYFRIGKISQAQFGGYAVRRGMACEVLEKFMGLEIVE